MSTHALKILCLALALGVSDLPSICLAAADDSTRIVIVSPGNASALEKLAAREVRRYLYLRTGLLAQISIAPRSLPPGNAVVVTRKDRPLAAALSIETASLEPQQYAVKTVGPKSSTVFIVGGDDAGTLYGAYRFAELLGVRFYLHGDVIPDEPIELKWPVANERSRPLFPLRGIQPFHDFAEGPDWWNLDDYLAIISQLPKLRMNFLGLHTYPENRPAAEPTVWIGLPSDLGREGKVKFSYPASYQNTLRAKWGYATMKTGDFICGSSGLFERDDFGPEIMSGACPEPATPEQCNLVFERTASLLREAFRQARQLAVRTCVGTETPLVIPKLVQDRLKAQGRNPTNLTSTAELYEAIFRRAAAAYDPDFYWFWTPEGWTWQGVSESEVRRTTNDLLTAYAVWKKVAPRFRLATCGWVLGPQTDRALFGRILPREVAVSCINRQVGYTPVDAGFADVQGRSKWAIPWLEDDGALTSPELWAARMRRDAADALRYGCDGLMGIHWRTRVLAPNVGALAQAGWDQRAWIDTYPQPVAASPAPRVAGPVGGQHASFPDHPIADSADAPLYQTVRYGLSAYHLPASNGPCRVTLKFCEPHYTAAGLRVFDVKLQGRSVIKALDIFAKAGQNRALDFTFTNVLVTNGWLDIDFVPRVEFPSIAALSVEGSSFNHKINCGGAAYKDYAADAPPESPPQPILPSARDFYEDWARHEFGPELGPEAAAIFLRMDGRLPRPSTWVNGPGGIQPDSRPWDQVKQEYAFVDDLAALEPRAKGEGSRERLEYWTSTFQFMRLNAQVNCSWAEYNRALQPIKAEKEPATQKRLAAERLLPLREKLVSQVNALFDQLLATVSTPGEMGTVANWNQHIVPGLLTQPGEELVRMLGAPLPANAQPARSYQGRTRLIVPTLRSSLRAGEALKLKVILLSGQPPQSAFLYWRSMGKGKFSKTPLQHVARNVYSVEIPPPARGRDLEYYLEAKAGPGERLYFPRTAPRLNQTVVTLD